MFLHVLDHEFATQELAGVFGDSAEPLFACERLFRGRLGVFCSCDAALGDVAALEGEPGVTTGGGCALLIGLLAGGYWVAVAIVRAAVLWRLALRRVAIVGL